MHNTNSISKKNCLLNRYSPIVDPQHGPNRQRNITGNVVAPLSIDRFKIEFAFLVDNVAVVPAAAALVAARASAFPSIRLRGFGGFLPLRPENPLKIQIGEKTTGPIHSDRTLFHWKDVTRIRFVQVIFAVAGVQ